MAEKLGIDGLSKIVKASAECANVASKLMNKGGLLALLGLQGPLSDLAVVNYPQAMEELKDLSSDERIQLEKLLSQAFAPVNPVVDKGLDSFLALGEKTVAVVQKGVTEGEDLFETAKALVVEWKSFLGVA